MKRTLWLLAMAGGLAVGTLWAGQETAPTNTTAADAQALQTAEQATALILVGDGSGRVKSAGVGVIVRSDGLMLSAYHLLKGALEVQVRLRDGEVYDQVELIGFDERRDVAVLHLSASALTSLPTAALGDSASGEAIHVLSADGMMTWSRSDGVLGPVRMADDVTGAGHGYKVVQFMAAVPAGTLGGALLNAHGQLLGIITAAADGVSRQFAVPAESVAGLPMQGLRMALGTGKNLQLPARLGHEDALLEGATPAEALARARTLWIRSQTVYFTPFMLQKALLKNASFRALDLGLIEGGRKADLTLVVDRPVFTYDFIYSLTDTHSGLVLATGKVVALDGTLAAEGIARKLVPELEKAQAVEIPQESRAEAVSAQW